MIVRYWRERFHLAVFAPLAGALAIAASAGGLTRWTFAGDTLFALLLLAEFRLRDDLADRDADACRHPGRVLVTSPNVDQFELVRGALTAANLLVCVVRAGADIAVPVLLALHAALAALYALRAGRSIAGDQLLLAKYPAFVVIVAGARALDAPLPIAVGAAFAYVAATLYEAWHDPSSPAAALLGGRP